MHKDTKLRKFLLKKYPTREDVQDLEPVKTLYRLIAYLDSLVTDVVSQEFKHEIHFKKAVFDNLCYHCWIEFNIPDVLEGPGRTTDVPEDYRDKRIIPSLMGELEKFEYFNVIKYSELYMFFKTIQNNNHKVRRNNFYYDSIPEVRFLLRYDKRDPNSIGSDLEYLYQKYNIQ